MSPRPRRALPFAVAAVLVASQIGLLASASPTSGPPPTPVGPKGSLSPFPSVLATPADPTEAPSVQARGALLADPSTGAVLYAKAPDAPRPVASLTKVMTALLVLERTRLDDVVTVDPEAVFTREDYGATSTLGLRAGERITVEDLLYGMLLGSANDAAVALAIHVSGSVEAFVRLMNRRATELGMSSTRFASASGLDDRGRSTPRDLFRLTRVANADPVFTRITATRERSITAPRGPARQIQNRNALLWLYPGAFGTKTGFTAAAGSCLIASAERDGRTLVAVLLHDGASEFSDAAALLNYGFDGFEERTVVRAGDPRGVVRIRGGSVPVEAGAGLLGWVPVAGALRETVKVDPRAAFPPAPGERVATLRIDAPAAAVGVVPLVVSSVPPPPQRTGPWWARAGVSVWRAAAGAVRALT
ncbi:MAG: D-alanyl-D-alanine carboxypeptidase family protein [Planctomycetaceae bacterium]